MYEPRLLNKAEERLAASPINAISLPVSFWLAKMIPNKEP